MNRPPNVKWLRAAHNFSSNQGLAVQACKPSLGTLGPEYCKFKASLGNLVRPCLKIKREAGYNSVAEYLLGVYEALGSFLVTAVQ